MPYKSKAQRRKFHAMADRGEISEETVDKWDRETGGKVLPKKLRLKKPAKKKKLRLRKQ